MDLFFSINFNISINFILVLLVLVLLVLISIPVNLWMIFIYMYTYSYINKSAFSIFVLLGNKIYIFLKNLYQHWLNSLCKFVALDKYDRETTGDRSTDEPP